MANSMKIKVIYSLWLHIKLQSMGFQPLTEMKNPNNEKFNCWAYEESPEFLDAFDSIMEGGCRND